MSRRILLALLFILVAATQAGTQGIVIQGGGGGGAAVPCGSGNEIQFRNGAVLGCDTDFSYNSTEDATSMKRPQITLATKGNTGVSPAPNMRDGSFQAWTLNGNATYAEPTNKAAGDTITLKTCQDGTGSRTLSFWSVTWLGGSPVMPTTATTGCLWVRVTYDGAAWSGVWSSTSDAGWPSSATDDAVPVGNGTDFQAKVIPACTDTTGNHLNYDQSTNSFSCGTSVKVQTYKIWMPAAGCDNATASSFWDLPTSNPAVAACVTGSNTQKGVLDFADGANTLSAQQTLLLPSDWTSTVDAKIKWFSSTTSGSVTWQITTACVADGETDDPAFNSPASAVVDATKGTANQTNDATISSITTTGCAAGELMHVKVFRDPTDGGDNMAGTARLIGVELTIRRAQ